MIILAEGEVVHAFSVPPLSLQYFLPNLSSKTFVSFLLLFYLT